MIMLPSISNQIKIIESYNDTHVFFFLANKRAVDSSSFFHYLSMKLFVMHKRTILQKICICNNNHFTALSDVVFDVYISCLYVLVKHSYQNPPATRVSETSEWYLYIYELDTTTDNKDL